MVSADNTIIAEDVSCDKGEAARSRAIAFGFKLLSVIILRSKAEPALSEAEGKNLVVCG